MSADEDLLRERFRNLVVFRPLVAEDNYVALVKAAEALVVALDTPADRVGLLLDRKGHHALRFREALKKARGD